MTTSNRHPGTTARKLRRAFLVQALGGLLTVLIVAPTPAPAQGVIQFSLGIGTNTAIFSFGSALLLSVLTAGITLSQDNNTNDGFGDERSTRDQVKDTLATALGQNLGEVSSEMIRREMSVQPTIKIRPGYRFNVLVNRDLIFEGPYLNTFVGGGLVP